jgi:hypothetical protein
MKEAEAFVLFPGGFGTLDELFELLTLSQTGKSDLHPIVMMEACGGDYWAGFDRAFRDLLMSGGYIDKEDVALYHMTDSVQEAVAHIQGFYRVYHSQRYVERMLVLRLKRELSDEELAALSAEFSDILSGPIQRTTVSSSERQDGDVPDLPRIRLPFDRTHYGRLRQLIDRINSAGRAD